MKKILAGLFLLFHLPAIADNLDDAIIHTAKNCIGIAAEFNKIKTMAGINTVVTGVGTLVGGGAIATGFIKQSKDAESVQLTVRLEELRKIESHVDNPTVTPAQLQEFETAFDNYFDTARQEIIKSETKLNKLDQQSKRLGNWRSGLMAGSTATSIAGVVISINSKASTDLKGAINDCKGAVTDLSNVYMQARLDGTDAEKLVRANNIITECRKWETTDTSKIDNRANNAMISSAVGGTVGLAGTIASATANTNKTRSGDAQREKNINTASNVLAIGATGASAMATIFNATQISAIKKASEVADTCEGALR